MGSFLKVTNIACVLVMLVCVLPFVLVEGEFPKGWRPGTPCKTTTKSRNKDQAEKYCRAVRQAYNHIESGLWDINQAKTRYKYWLNNARKPLSHAQHYLKECYEIGLKWRYSSGDVVCRDANNFLHRMHSRMAAIVSSKYSTQNSIQNVYWDIRNYFGHLNLQVTLWNKRGKGKHVYLYCNKSYCERPN